MINSFTKNYRFLSNFYPCTVTDIDNRQYRSVEHAFQAAKCVSIPDCELIRNAETPSEAKKLGHKIKIRPDWEVVAA